MQPIIKFVASTGFVLSLSIAMSFSPLQAVSCQPIDGRELKERLEMAVMSDNLTATNGLFNQYYGQDCLAVATGLETAPPKSAALSQPIDGRELKERLEQAIMSDNLSATGELFEQYYAGQSYADRSQW